MSPPSFFQFLRLHIVASIWQDVCTHFWRGVHLAEVYFTRTAPSTVASSVSSRRSRYWCLIVSNNSYTKVQVNYTSYIDRWMWWSPVSATRRRVRWCPVPARRRWRWWWSRCPIQRSPGRWNLLSSSPRHPAIHKQVTVATVFPAVVHAALQSGFDPFSSEHYYRVHSYADPGSATFLVENDPDQTY
jgi:hypothetical protein